MGMMHYVVHMTTAWETGTIPEFGLSDRLRKAREFAGMDIKEFAKHIGVSRNTIGNYESADYDKKRQESTIKLWACSTHAQTPMRDATATQLEAWLYRNPRASAWTKTTYYRALDAFYGWMLRTDRLERSPMRTMLAPATPKSQPRPLPPEDLAEAIRCARSHEMRAWLVLAGFAGLRAGEVARLRREDVQARATHPTIQVVNGKGGKDRTVIVGKVVLDALAPFMSRRGPLWDASPRDVSRKASEHFKALSMPWTLHSCRHGFATQIYGATRDLRLTQELMGHSSPATTAIYAAVDRDAAARAVAMIEEGWAA